MIAKYLFMTFLKNLNLFICIIHLAEPSLVLPMLVSLVLSSKERVQLSSSGALVGVLKYHNQNAEVICLLLDCLRYFAI